MSGRSRIRANHTYFEHICVFVSFSILSHQISSHLAVRFRLWLNWNGFSSAFHFRVLVCCLFYCCCCCCFQFAFTLLSICSLSLLLSLGVEMNLFWNSKLIEIWHSNENDMTYRSTTITTATMLLGLSFGQKLPILLFLYINFQMHSGLEKTMPWAVIFKSWKIKLKPTHKKKRTIYFSVCL